jgi:hypothetical protein
MVLILTIKISQQFLHKKVHFLPYVQVPKIAQNFKLSYQISCPGKCKVKKLEILRS